MDYQENLVSIITPAHNSAQYIAECIESVLQQTYKNWELLIVDDASIDNTVDIVEKFAKVDQRIKLIKSIHNVGAAEARNIAIRNSIGQYIAFLDSDDLWLPEKLERHLSWMTCKQYAFTFSSYKQISEFGADLLKPIVAPSKISYNQYLSNTIIGCLTVVIDRKFTGYFEMPLIRSSHDMALWLILLKRVKYAYGIIEELALYRILNNSNSANKFKAAKDVWKVYRNFEKLNLLFSLIHFFGYVYNAIKKRI